MSIDTIEKKKIAGLILGLEPDETRKSTLQLALENARHHIGIKDGEKPRGCSFNFRHDLVEKLESSRGRCSDEAEHETNEENSFNDRYGRCSDEAEIFCGLLLYLNVLEQIGTLFCKDENETNGIKKAIKAFSTKKFNKLEIKAIKDLRNSLAHNFGLVGYDTKNKKPTMKFTICIYFSDEIQTIVELPKPEWDGSFSDKSDETQCKIYAFPLFNLVEEVIEEVKKQYKSDKLQFAIGDLEEIKSRFTIRT
ncbi:hypothetical protein [Porphyromonas endodontalis]|jgi:hypothetical protein|uniref:hypothetical protein n=1 Tax=Porphyromonas endodontalis TaxID=28124 RepID=UPI0036235CBA